MSVPLMRPVTCFYFYTLIPACRTCFDAKVLAAVKQNGFSAGAFSLGIDSETRTLRIIERVANWRSHLLQMPYGDQALFVCRDLFNNIGGFPDFPIMEDFETDPAPENKR